MWSDHLSTPEYITIHSVYNTANSRFLEIRKHELAKAAPDLTKIDRLQALVTFIGNTSSSLVDNLWTIEEWNELGLDTPVLQKDEWSESNKWMHKNDYLNAGLNFEFAQPARLPIIEYDPFIQLNEWTFTKPKWKYRKDLTTDYVSVDFEPTLSDINERFKHPVVGTNLASSSITVKGK